MRRTLFLSLWLAGLATALAVDPAPAPGTGTYLLMPEPRVMGTAVSRPFARSRQTVFTPTRRDAGGKLHSISSADFAKLGLSWDSYLERAQAAADRRLAAWQPELIKGEDGKVAYAVYRSDDPTVACLLIAPSLAAIFKNIFGAEVWAVAPDRHSLFVFPARQAVLDEFADDLRERFEDNPFAASEEVFGLKEGAPPRVVASLTGGR